MSDTTYIKLLLNRIALMDSYILMLLSKDKEEYLEYQNIIEERLQKIMGIDIKDIKESSGISE